MIYAIGLIISYLLGSIPVGLLLARLAGKGDLRQVGSGNIGATNVMRVGGARLAILTWLLDMAKAFAAVFIGMALIDMNFGAWCGAMAVVGHCWPIWLRFRGGKGISAMFGVMLAVSPLTFVVCAAQWLVVALGLGYSSAGALVALCMMPIMGFAIGKWIGFAFLAIWAIGMWRHRANIGRLIHGTESKIEWKWKK